MSNDYQVAYPRASNPSALAPSASGAPSVPFNIYVNLPSGGAAGTADDVTVFNANAPYPFRIVNVQVLVATAVAASTVQLRSASGGGGSVLSSAIAVSVAGFVPNADTQTRTVAAAGSVFVRRSDRSMVGELIISCIRT